MEKKEKKKLKRTNVGLTQERGEHFLKIIKVQSWFVSVQNKDNKKVDKNLKRGRKKREASTKANVEKANISDVSVENKFQLECGGLLV
jgi:hypothetical protein